MEKVQRKMSYDILRVLACFLVIVNHTNSDVFLSVFPTRTGWLSLLYFFVSKSAVPIFFMLTGALLLDKQESYQVIFKKRIARIFIALLVFSLIFYFFYNHTLSGFFLKIYTSPVIIPYWYLYAYLGLLVCLPWLRKMISLFCTKDYLLFTLAFLIFTGILPVLSAEKVLPQLAVEFSIPFVAAPIGYVVCGKFISNFVRMNSLIAVVIYELFIFLLSYIITKLLQKIPIIKRII